MIAAKVSETDFGIAAVVLVVLLVLAYRLLRRDSGIRITRLGVFVERERFDDDQDELRDDWPRGDDTVELPPH